MNSPTPTTVPIRRFSKLSPTSSPLKELRPLCRWLEINPAVKAFFLTSRRPVAERDQVSHVATRGRRIRFAFVVRGGGQEVNICLHRETMTNDLRRSIERFWD